MYKELDLETSEGVKTFGFLATGTTATRYRLAFGTDLMVSLMALNSDNAVDIDMTVGDKLAYIMNAQAEGKDMSKLNMDSFLAWADQFDGAELSGHLNDFTGLYFGSRKTTSTAKKEDGPQTVK